MKNFYQSFKKFLLLLAIFSLTTGQVQCRGIRDLVGPDPENFNRERLSTAIQTLINFFVYIAGSILMLYLIIGGYQYLTSLGNPEQAQKAKTSLTWAILGFIIVAMAYLVVRFAAGLLLNRGTFGDIFQ